MDIPGFRKNVVGLLLGQVSRLLVQAAYFVVLARMLGASGYGAFASALALTALAAPFSSLGCNTLMIKNVARDHASARVEWSRAVTASMLVGVALTLLLTGLTPLVAPSDISPWTLFQIGIAELVGLKLVEVTGSVWQALGKSRPLIILPTVVNLLRLAAALCVYFVAEAASLEAWSLVYLLATLPIGILVVVHTTLKLGVASRRPRLRLDEVKEGLLYSVGLSSQNVYNDIDKAMLARLDSSTSAGLYSAAYRIIDMAYAPIRSVAAAAYPLYFREGSEGLSGALRLTRKIAPAVIALAVIAGGGAYFVAPYAPMILGSDYDDAVDLIRLLFPLILLRGLSFLAADTLTGAGSQGFRTIVQIVVAIVNVALNLWLIPVYGVFGAVVSTLVCELVLGVALWLGIVFLRRCSR